ncbi:hypothetical protein P8C59_006601 [Phyllachora maydis]|uniref:Uncharacterized protein n=1 Tax=Phyllachora maydis TaxID=1825666 RepID=A0AAD9I7Z9_9PEZI|nr:hypothetical protein P8C59_006601 [Phyllachora maydis]
MSRIVAMMLSPLAATTRRKAASRLLAALLTHLPQRHLTPDSRGLLDRTAVLVHDREAMFASCLHPYRSSNGRYNPTVLPFLVRRFPDDQGVEILRANLRSVASTGGGGYQQNPGDEEGLNGLLSEWQPAGGTDAAAASGAASLGAAAGCSSGEEQDTTASSRDGMAANTDSMDVDSAPTETSAPQGGFNFVGRPVVPLIEESMQSVGEASQTPLHADAPVSLKRKAEAPEQPGSPKRIDKGKAVDATVAPVPVARSALSMNNDADADADSDSDSESSVSVQIDMTMDDDDDDDDEDEDGDSDEA